MNYNNKNIFFLTLAIEPAKHLTLEEIVLQKHKSRMEEVQHKLKEVEMLKRPVSKKEFEREAQKMLPYMSKSNMKEEIDKLFMRAATIGRDITREDLITLKSETLYKFENEWQDLDTHRDQLMLDLEIAKEEVEVSEYAITPYPSETYDPQDIYDLKNDMSHPIRPTFVRGRNWFDLPGSEYKRTEGDMFKFSLNDKPKFFKRPIDKYEDSDRLHRTAMKESDDDRMLKERVEKFKGVDKTMLRRNFKRRQKAYQKDKNKN